MKIFMITLGVILGFLFILFIIFSSGIIFRIFAPIKDAKTATENGKEALTNKKVIAIAAHPDDLEYWIGGTLGKLAQNGSEVTVVICTKNGKNGDIRKEEQKKAGEILGYKEIIFLDLPDGDLINHQAELTDKLQNLFKTLKPEAIFTFDIEKEGLLYHHRDHETVGKVSLEVSRDLKLSHIYFYHTSAPDTAIDVTELIDKKIKAFAAHESQHPSFFRQDFSGWQLRRTLSIYGNMIGVPYAEPLRKGW